MFIGKISLLYAHSNIPRIHKFEFAPKWRALAHVTLCLACTKKPWRKINNIVFCLPFLFFLHSIGFYSLRDNLWFSTNILFFFSSYFTWTVNVFVIDPFKKLLASDLMQRKLSLMCISSIIFYFCLVQPQRDCNDVTFLHWTDIQFKQIKAKQS